MGERRRNVNKRLVAASASMFSLSMLFQILARKVPGFGDWYAKRIYPVMVGSVGRLSGIFPFALVELLAYLFLLSSIVYTVLYFRDGKKILIRAMFVVTGLFFLFTFQCGINYYRKPFSSYSGLDVRMSSIEELRNLCLQLTKTVNQLCEQGFTKETDINSTRRESVKAMKNLGETYPELAGFYPYPKPLLWSDFFSIQQLCGQYSPFTVEATYNRSMPDYNIPHTVCHELSHLRGFMREDEANFIGYLACIGSDDDAFRYSGYLTGWVYATNALAKKDPAAYADICRQLDQRAWDDLWDNNEFWGRYDGKTAEVANQINDTYLKINSQTDGVDSYGRMVDLMLAYERTKSTSIPSNLLKNNGVNAKIFPY